MRYQIQNALPNPKCATTFAQNARKYDTKKPTGRQKLFGKATKKQSDKEFSIIPYHSACPCEYPCGATFAPKKAVTESIAVLLIIYKQAVAHCTSAVID